MFLRLSLSIHYAIFNVQDSVFQVLACASAYTLKVEYHINLFNSRFVVLGILFHTSAWINCKDFFRASSRQENLNLSKFNIRLWNQRFLRSFRCRYNRNGGYRQFAIVLLNASQFTLLRHIQTTSTCWFSLKPRILMKDFDSDISKLKINIFIGFDLGCSEYLTF